jgi:hypothetical protein
MSRKGLLDDASLVGIPATSLSDEDQEIARQEYAVAIVLDRLQWDIEFRRRVRGLLKELPAEKKPGPKPVMSDAVVYELIKALQSHGNTLTKCYDLLARDGLTTSSIKRKFKRYRSKSKAKG